MLFLSTAICAQIANEKLAGYWMEKSEGDDLSLSTLLVFDVDETGELEGSVYFMESKNSDRKFTLADILMEGNKFSFRIEQTTISFYGELNAAGEISKGTFYLEDKTSLEVLHEKLSNDNLRGIFDWPQFKERFIKKEVGADDGLLIG